MRSHTSYPRALICCFPISLLCPKKPIAALLDGGDFSPVFCCCYFGVDPFAA